MTSSSLIKTSSVATLGQTLSSLNTEVAVLHSCMLHCCQWAAEGGLKVRWLLYSVHGLISKTGLTGGNLQVVRADDDVPGGGGRGGC